MTILDGRKTTLDEIAKSEENLKIYLAAKFKHYINNLHFMGAIPGHLAPYKSGVEKRTKRLKKVLGSIAKLGLMDL